MNKYSRHFPNFSFVFRFLFARSLLAQDAPHTIQLPNGKVLSPPNLYLLSTPRERNNLCPSSIWKQRNSPDSPADRLGSKARQGSQVDRHRRGRADDSGYVSRFACVTRHPANSRQTLCSTTGIDLPSEAHLSFSPVAILSPERRSPSGI